MIPTTIFIDLDGVLRLWPRDYSELEQAYDLPAGAIVSTAFEPTLLNQAITGRITDRAWRSEITNRLSAAYPSCRAEEAVMAWSKPVGEIHGEVLQLMVEARKHCQVGLITNATDRLSVDLQSLSLNEHFDFLINSSEVGVAKPSPEIFAHALAMAGIHASEAIFIDDTLKNVQAAEKLGIRSHHFVSAAALHEYLRSVGLGANVA
jgi:putative hydrolase of the HAD superfamily